MINSVYKWMTYGVFALLLTLMGCASNLQSDEAIKRIQAALRDQNPLSIQESQRLNNSVAENPFSAQGGNNPGPVPVFESSPATAGVVNAYARKPARPLSNDKASITLNFENADLREVVKFIMTDLLAQNYILSPAVQGRVTVQTSSPIRRSDLLPTLETLLKVNNAVIVTDNDLIRILPVSQANRGHLSPRVGKIKRLKPGYEVRIIPLKYLSATDAQKTLAPFLPNGSLLAVDPIKNILTVAGTSSELANIQKTIDTFDVDWLKGMSVGIYHLQNVSIDEVLPEIEGLFGQGGSTPFAGFFHFVPMERLNAIMVITRQPSYLNEANRWLKSLDRRDNIDEERLYVYRVQNGSAEDLAGVLSGIFASSDDKETRRKASVASGSGVTANTKASSQKNRLEPVKASKLADKTEAKPAIKTTRAVTITGASATISADESNNSLVIKATPANYDLVLQALRQLDIPKLQVLLDVVVAEINLTGNLQYGFNYWLQEGQGDKEQGLGFGGSSYTPSSLIRPQEKGSHQLSTSIPDHVPVFQYTLNNLIPGRLNVAINALAAKGLARFLSTPSLMVLDNKTAKMNVGQKLALEDSTTDDGKTTTSTSYIDTGVALEITPRVTADGNVQLEIDQSVSRPGARNRIGSPDLYSRDISSTIIARDRQTIVLGGLIQEENSNDHSGVPLLQDIPGVGALFRGTQRKTSRTELIVLITPKVARNADETLNITKAFRARMKGLDIYHETQQQKR